VIYEAEGTTIRPFSYFDPFIEAEYKETCLTYTNV